MSLNLYVFCPVPSDIKHMKSNEKQLMSDYCLILVTGISF